MMKRYLKHETLVIGFLYGLLVSLVYLQVAFLGKTLLPSLYSTHGVTQTGPYQYNGRKPINTFNIDLATPAYYENPVNRLIGNIYLRGELPLWNPYQAAGTPLAAQYSTRAFFPYQILEDLSPYWMWDFFMLGRLWIAGFFTFLFLRTIGLSTAPSFLAGAFFMFSGSMTWFINLEQFANVAMLVPVAFFAVEKLIQTRNNGHTALTGMTLAFVLLAGQPETALYLFFMLAGYIVFRLVRIRRNGTSVHALLPRLFISGMMGFGMSAPLWIPFIEFMGLSHHIHPIGGRMGVDSASIFNATAIFMPTFFDLPISFPTGPENGRWDLLGGYCGILVFYLSILGMLFRSRYNGYALFFGLFGLFILLKNFGFPLATWIGYLPLFDQVWTPRWAGPAWTFSFSVTGAIGLETARRRFSEPDKRVEWSQGITRMLTTLKGRIGFNRITSKKITVFIVLSCVGLLLTGHSFGQAYMYWRAVTKSIEQLHATDEAKRDFMRLLSGGNLVIEIVGPSGVGKEPLEAFNRINAMKNRMRSLWKALCLQIIVLSVLLLWFRGAKYSKPIDSVMGPKNMFGLVTITCCLCLAGLYLLNVMDLSLFLSALTTQEELFFLPSFLGGLLVTFSVIGTVTLLALQFQDERTFTCAVLALGLVELWFFIPRGYDVYQLYWKLIPFAAAMAGVFALARRRWYWAASAFLCTIVTYTWIDMKSSHGLPERYDPFIQPPYVDFMKKDKDFGRIMALGGTLMPNFSSAFQLQDIRFVNALSVADYQRYIGHLLPSYSRPPGDPASLWFTGMPTSDSSLAALRENSPYLSLLGVKYIVTPNSMNLDFLPLVYDDEVHIYKMLSFVPRVFVARQVEYVNSPGEAAERVRALGPDIADKIILEKKIPRTYLGAGTGREPGSYSSIQAYDSNRVVIKARLKKAGVLVLTDVFYPGWRAYVDGKRTEVLRVNGLVRGIVLQEGTHTVVFRYLPDTFVTGVIVAAICFACFITMLCVSARKANIVASRQADF